MPCLVLPQAKDKKGGGGGGGLTLDGVFVLSPGSLDLKVDETQELTVYGFPVENGPVEDVIICRYTPRTACYCRRDSLLLPA